MVRPSSDSALPDTECPPQRIDGGSPFGARDVDGGDHVRGAGAAQDHAGALVDHGVPHRACGAVVGVVRADAVALEPGAQLVGDAQPQLLIDGGG